MKRNNPPAGKNKSYRFYKSNLPGVIWDGGKDAPLAEFKNGTFTTDNLEVAKVLLDNGYPQIPPDATKPPNILVRIPGNTIKTSDDETSGVEINPNFINTDSGGNAPIIQEGLID